MTIFNQQTLLGTRPTKTQQSNNPTYTKKIELKKRRKKGVNTYIPTRWVHVQQKTEFMSNQIKKTKKEEC